MTPPRYLIHTERTTNLDRAVFSRAYHADVVRFFETKSGRVRKGFEAAHANAVAFLAVVDAHAATIVIEHSHTDASGAYFLARPK